MTDDDPLIGYRERVGEMAARAREVSAQIASIRPSATSSDGAVTVTLTATGALSGIDFGAAARQLDLPSLADVIMRTSQTARVQAAQATQDALLPLVGQSSMAMRVLQAQVADQTDALGLRPAARPDSRQGAGYDRDRDEEDGFAGRGVQL